MLTLNSALSNRFKQKTIPAVVVDVLGNKCSVRLSGRGTKLTALIYVGSIPKVGDNVLVDYRSSNTPVVLTSGYADIVKARPITAAAITGITRPAEIISTDTIYFPDPDDQKYIVKNGEWVGFDHSHNNWDGSSNIAQAESHANPDTDQSSESLHHTLGTGEFQAAAGNHTHGTNGATVVSESLIGIINGANTEFFTTNVFQGGTSVVAVNGLEQLLEADYYEYPEDKKIVFSDPPSNVGFSDTLHIRYFSA